MSLKLYDVWYKEIDDETDHMLVRAANPRDAALFVAGDLGRNPEEVADVINALHEVSAFAPVGVVGKVRQCDYRYVPTGEWII